MKHAVVVLMTVLLAGLAFATAPEVKKAVAREKAVDLSILPEAVLKAFQSAYPKALITGTGSELEQGITLYEIESRDGAQARDLLYAADGQIVEIEETVAVTALPAAVAQALKKDFAAATVLKAEILTKGESKTYEVQIKIKNRKREIAFDAAGKQVTKPAAVEKK